MLCKLSCPLSEKAPIETDSSFNLTSQLHLIALNVLVTSGMTYATVTSSFLEFVVFIEM
jgi:hypothetical protein